jgi:diguanylate cyclase (GGDEF)-like protein
VDRPQDISPVIDQMTGQQQTDRAAPELVVFAAPLADPMQAGDAVIAILGELGHGRWRIDWEDHTTSGEGFLIVDRHRSPIAAVEPVDATARAAPLGVVRRCAELVATVADARERLAVEQERARRAQAEARTDELTRLPNRRTWRAVINREAARCDRHQLSLAVVIVDLDGLKALNDEHGHLAGDMLLRLAADTLRSAVRAEDLVARLGGDEFGILAVEHQPPGCEPIIARVTAACADADLRASIGGAVRLPGEPVDGTVRRADEAMYSAKRKHLSY